MMRLCFLLLISLTGSAQVKKADTVFCDCEFARVVTISGSNSVTKTIAPPGPGLNSEISPRKLNTRFAFEKEHHSAWYKLIISASGKLVFDIMPAKPDDDYDFMLFKSSTKNFCDSLQNYPISPVRACISRDKEELKGKTGLDHTSKEALVKQGVASSYGKALDVKAGETYYLVLDNVYDNGDGHSIRFEVSEKITIKGILKNELDEPVKAEVSLTDQKGQVVFQTETGKDGTYKFTQNIVSNLAYTLNFYSDSSFSYTKAFTLKDTGELKDLKTILPELKKGNKHSVGAVNFFPHSTSYLPRAVPAMRNLYKLLHKNPNLKIMIIGHCNGVSIKKKEQKDLTSMALSKGRARAIKDYLVAQGIDEKRISTDGKGDSEMLFPPVDLRSEQQQEANRRVEVLVLEY